MTIDCKAIFVFRILILKCGVEVRHTNRVFVELQITSKIFDAFISQRDPPKVGI